MFKFPFRARCQPPHVSPPPDIHDPQLVRALRALPTPVPGADFDRKVLAALGAPPRAARSSALLPRLALAAGFLLLLLPGTRATLRAAVYLHWSLFLPERFEAAPSAADPDSVPAAEQWVRNLPSPLRQPNLFFAPHKRQAHTRFITGYDHRLTPSPLNDAYLMQSGVFDRLQSQYGDQPSFLAARLRHALGNDFGLSEEIVRRRKGDFSHRQGRVPSLLPRSVRELESIAERGSLLDPRNAFFPAMRAVLLFSERRDREAVVALQSVVDKPDWNDYGFEEVAARFRWETSRRGASVLNTAGIVETPTLPSEALLLLARHASSYAASQERVGNLKAGAAIRVAILDLDAKVMRREPVTFSLTSSALGYLATQAIGGIEPTFNDSGFFPLSAADAARLQTKWLSKNPAQRKRLIRQERQAAWLLGRPARLAVFLRANGQQSRADWADGLLQTVAARDQVVMRYWEKRRTDSDDLPEQIVLKLLWMCLAPVTLAVLAAPLYGALLRGLCAMPGLARREEFPPWAIVGISVGSVMGGLALLFDGAFNLRGASLVALSPAFVTLVLGVGYLRLRRPKAIALSGLAAVGGFAVSFALHKLSLALLLRSALLWTGDPDVLAGPYPRLHPVPHAAWATLPVAVLLLSVACSLYQARRRERTWQNACRQAASVSCQCAWGGMLLIVFYLCALHVAERATAQALLLHRRDEAQQIVRVLGEPLPQAPLHPTQPR